jgi:hypothetical protein
VARTFDEVDDHSEQRDKRVALLLNGNLNLLCDIQENLSTLRPRLSRHSRLILVAYNPFMSLAYALAAMLGLRTAPKPDVYLTENDLYTFGKLAGYEVVRLRPCGFIPIGVPFISNLLNKVLPVIPLVRRLALVWVVVLRPVIPETRRLSLSVIIPARNESGNIENAIK